MKLTSPSSLHHPRDPSQSQWRDMNCVLCLVVQFYAHLKKKKDLFYLGFIGLRFRSGGQYDILIIFFYVSSDNWIFQTRKAEKTFWLEDWGYLLFRLLHVVISVGGWGGIRIYLAGEIFIQASAICYGAFMHLLVRKRTGPGPTTTGSWMA